MRNSLWILVVFLLIGGSAQAQQLEPPKGWDVSATAGFFNAKPVVTASVEGPDGNGTLYQDDWYFQGRYAVTIGRYWTEHLKTEVEYAISGEGRRFLQGYKTVQGVPFDYPYYGESFHRLEQVSARMLWQFRENTWVHPYISGGLAGDRERQRVRIPEQYQYPGGRINDPVLVSPEFNSGPEWKYRLGFTAGAGAKFYMTRDAFFTTGIVGTWSQPTATVSVLAGFGIDF